MRALVRRLIEPVWRWCNPERHRQTKAMRDMSAPVGTIHQVMGDWAPQENEEWCVPDGRWLRKDRYPELWLIFDRAGTDYGDNEDTFRIPDFTAAIDRTMPVESIDGEGWVSLTKTLMRIR